MVFEEVLFFNIETLQAVKGEKYKYVLLNHKK